MENHLERILDDDEVVHHINEDKKDNRPENLKVISVTEHASLHAKTGRSMVELKCPQCGVLFRREKRKTYLSKNGTYSCCSRSCNGKFSRKLQIDGKTPEVEQAISENLVREFNTLDNSEETG